jgi:hypothetical protein
MSQGDHCSQWASRYQGSRPPSRDPLETHQQRQLPLHSFGQAQRMIHEAQHCDGGLLLAFARWSAAAIGWIRYEGSAAIGHNLARQEVYPSRAKPVISDVRGRYAVAVALQHGRDCSGTAAWFPHSSMRRQAAVSYVRRASFDSWEIARNRLKLQGRIWPRLGKN